MTDWLGPPIDVRPLFAGEHLAFVDLLRGLSAEEWERPTVCPGWSVKDVAAHVLGDHVWRLSSDRDGFVGISAREGEAFTSYLDRVNEEWVEANRRLSTRVLVRLLSDVGDEVVDFWRTADLSAVNTRVSWAGEGPHPAWLDAAREYTEYWTHHRQIAEAAGREGPDLPEVVLDTFVRAMPYTLRNEHPAEGTVLQIVATGQGGGEWTCTRGAGGWSLDRGTASRQDARLELDSDTAWRLCTRGVTPEDAARTALIDGDLAETALTVVSIIWSPV